MKEYTVSNDLISRPEQLKKLAEIDGYLFFRGLLDRSSILDLRCQVLAISADAGWLQDGATLEDGIAAEGLDVYASPDFPTVYGKIQRLEAFHSLAHRPELLAVTNTLFDNRTVVHPRHILRVVSPKPGLPPAPPHQDFIHIQGTEETWTAWLPLHDCPRELGSLASLSGSHMQERLSGTPGCRSRRRRNRHREPATYGQSNHRFRSLATSFSSTVCLCARGSPTSPATASGYRWIIVIRIGTNLRWRPRSSRTATTHGRNSTKVGNPIDINITGKPFQFHSRTSMQISFKMYPMQDTLFANILTSPIQVERFRC